MDSVLKKPVDRLTIVFAIVLIVLVGLSGFSYYRLTRQQSLFVDLQEDYALLQEEYLTLFQIYHQISEFYNETQGMYTTLTEEYTVLGDLHTEILQDKTELENRLSELENEYSTITAELRYEYYLLGLERDDIQREYDDLVNYRKTMFLAENTTISLEPDGTADFTYQIDYAGYMEVNFSSTTDIYFWVGSNVAQDYYSRYPPFPDTAFNGTYTVPVCQTVYVRIENADPDNPAEVTLTIKVTY